MKYLGVPVTFSSLKVCDPAFREAKMIKRLDAWVGGSASSGARLTLVNSSLTGIPSYLMSMFLFNKIFLKNLTNLVDVSFGREGAANASII